MAKAANKPPFPLPQVEPDLRKWPLYRLNQDKEAFRNQVVAETIQAIRSEYRTTESLASLLATTLYHEKIRLTRKPWSTDPPDEKPFWRNVEKQLTELDPEQAVLESLLEAILQRYVREMQGSFDPGTYRFARKFLPVMFNRLLNASSNKNFSRVFGNQYGINDRIHIDGDVERMRKIVREGGTLVIMPTHFSNLDSILIGYAIDAIGLPGFLYGAGLNLFSARILAYFMNRLGAYKLDRRKKNRIYLEALKAFSTQAMLRGCHSLFFPGGTRSRSGSVEKQLKLGLMGTVVEAQRRMLQEASAEGPYHKIFVVTLNLSYNFVLEAPALIKDHLQAVGRERFFVEQDRFSTSGKIARFILRFFTTGSDIRLRFGDPMDILGNPIDADGRSLDPQGNPIPLRSYFSHMGSLTEDEQRDSVYTKILGEKVVESLHRHNTVMATHVVAYAAFILLQRRYPELDLYQLLRLPQEDRHWNKGELEVCISRLQAVLAQRQAAGTLFAEPVLDGSPPEVLRHGIRNLGIYHDQRALREHRQRPEAVSSDDLNLLYFYHNRLEGYGLDGIC